MSDVGPATAPRLRLTCMTGLTINWIQTVHTQCCQIAVQCASQRKRQVVGVAGDAYIKPSMNYAYII